jgi:hypothetical protein
LKAGAALTAAKPIQGCVDEIARELSPDVVSIRSSPGLDWSEHPAIYFRVIISDSASRGDKLARITSEVSRRVADELGLATSERIPYFRFRSQSEQAQLNDPAWD